MFIYLADQKTKERKSFIKPNELEEDLLERVEQNEFDLILKQGEKRFQISWLQETEETIIIEFYKGALVKQTEFYFVESAIDEIVEAFQLEN